MRIVNKGDLALTAYVDEQKLNLLEEGQDGVFFSNHELFGNRDVTLKAISSFAVEQLYWNELSSVYNGPLAADIKQDQNAHTPRSSLYELKFSPKSNGKAARNLNTVKHGTIIIGSGYYSYAYYIFQSVLAFVQSEISINT